MKKLICLLGHNKKIMKLGDCIKESFENNDRAVTVLRCKYCGKDIAVYTRFIKAHFNEAFTSDSFKLE